MKDESIVKPPPYQGFDSARVVYIPADTPSRFIFKAIQKRIIDKRTKPFGQVFRLEDKVIVYQCVGSPTAVMTLERLIVSGAREILILGFCGSLSRKTKILDAVSISSAVSEEGTSKHYYPRKKIHHPSSIMRKKIETALQTRRLPFRIGTVVSTDVPYRETRAWLEDKQRRGIDFVDMEASAIFALASFHSLQAAALMLVSDQLSLKGHKIGFHRPMTEERMRQYFLPFLMPD